MRWYIPKDEVKEFDKDFIVYEKSYAPLNDSFLLDRKVIICANTTLKDGNIRNKIIFLNQTNGRVGRIGVEFTEESKLSKDSSPEEQYVILTSAVGCLVETGIKNTLMELYRTKPRRGNELIKMDSLFRIQLLWALDDVAPDETKNLVLFLLGYIFDTNPKQIEVFSEDVEGIINVYFDNDDLWILSQKGWLVRLCSHLKRDIAARPNLDVRIVKVLAGDYDWHIRIEIAARDDLPEDIIKQLANDMDWRVRIAVAKRKELPDDIVKDLANDICWEVRSVIAGRKKISENIIRCLANDERCEVRNTIADRRDLPEDIIRNLVYDSESSVRMSVAGSSNLPDDLLKVLADDKDWEVRREVAQRRGSLPADVLARLLRDSHSEVCRAVIMRRDLTDDLIRSLADSNDDMFRVLLAGRAKLPSDVVRKLALDVCWQVRKKIAERVDLPGDLVYLLAEDSDSYVRETIAKRKDLPNNLIGKLSNDRNMKVRLAASNRRT